MSIPTKFTSRLKENATIADVRNVLYQVIREVAADTGFDRLLVEYYSPLVLVFDEDYDKTLATEDSFRLVIFGIIDLIFDKLDNVQINYFGGINKLLYHAKNLDEVSKNHKSFKNFFLNLEKDLAQPPT